MSWACYTWFVFDADSFPSTIQYWRLIETHKPSCDQAYSSKTKLSSPLLVRPPFELGSWKAERRKTLPFSSKLCLLAQIAWLWPLWGVLEALLFFQILIQFFLFYFISTTLPFIQTLSLGPDCPVVTFVRLRFCSWYFFFVSYFIFKCQGLKSKLFAKIWFWYAVPLS